MMPKALALSGTPGKPVWGEKLLQWSEIAEELFSNPPHNPTAKNIKQQKNKRHSFLRGRVEKGIHYVVQQVWLEYVKVKLALVHFYGKIDSGL